MKFELGFPFVGIKGEAEGIPGIVALSGIVALVIIVIALVAVVT